MINNLKMLRLLRLTIVVTGFVLFFGNLADTNAQTRDPFAKPGWARTKETRPGGNKGANGGLLEPSNLAAPAIEQRIAHYKQLRAFAAANGQPIPKVTSVLTLNEMSVTGIFKTPRGYAAIVEAMPIKLSYTIYPGEKFFDGQLVAVDENRLVFRRVTKMSNGKFVASVENKAMRQYTERGQIQGAAPMQTSAGNTSQGQVDGKTAAVPIVSPLDEMNQKAVPESESAKEPAKSKKPTRVVRNK